MMLRDLLLTPLHTDKIKLIPESTLTAEQSLIVTQISENRYPRQTIPEMKQYKHFKPELYQALHPYLKLAYTFENNGDIEEHTKKLACLFDNLKEALDYLNDFARKNPTNTQFVHDACLFQLPDPKNFSVWKKLAKKNLANNTFRRLLSLSSAINTQIEKDQKEKKQLEEDLFKRHEVEYHQDQLIVLENKIKQEIKKRNQFCRYFNAHHHQMSQDPKNVEKNILYLSELTLLYSDRAILNLRKKIGQYGLKDFEDVYKRILTQTDPAKEIFIKNGIDDKYYTQFTSLDRKDAGKNIPDVGIFDCKNGYYIRKLNVADQKDGALAACLGKLTGCCQSLTGELGRPCVIHGLTHPDSGFYVLFKGDAKNPQSTDTVYGQTWVNRTPSGNLLFDSIESKQGKIVKDVGDVVKQAFRSLAVHLVQHENIARVQAGLTSGLSSTSIKSSYLLSKEPPKEYEGYRDSFFQGMLADQLLLGTFNKDDEFEVDTNAVKIAFKDGTHLPKNILFTIGFLLQNVRPLDKFLESVPEEFRKEIEEYINRQKKFKAQVEEYEKDPSTKDILLELLKRKPLDFNFETEKASTILFIASSVGDTDVVKALLAAKASPDIQNTSKNTPVLIEAAKNGHTAVVKMLLDAKAQVDLQDPSGNTALMMATRGRNINMLIDLLDTKAAINIQDSSGNTALMLATTIGDRDIVTQLLAQKAEVDFQEQRGITALMMAAKGGNKNIVTDLLKAKAAVNIQSSLGNTALLLAARIGNKDIIIELLEAKATVNTQAIYDKATALIEATGRGHVDVVRVLLDAKASPDVQTTSGTTALILTAGSGGNQTKAIVTALLEAKANIDLQDSKGNTGLILAIKEKKAAIIRILLQARASVNTQDALGKTPLMHAVEINRKDIARALLIMNATVDTLTDGITPLMKAIKQKNPDLIKLLLDARASVQFIEDNENFLQEIDEPIKNLLYPGKEKSSKTSGIFAPPSSKDKSTKEETSSGRKTAPPKT